MSSTDNRNKLIQIYIEKSGTDNVDVSETNIQGEIDEMRNIMEQLMSVVSRNVSDAVQPRIDETIKPENNIPRNDLPETPSRSAYSVKEIAETIPEFSPTDDISLSAE